MKKILVVGYVWPEPNSSAAGSHILSILSCFKQAGWQITFSSPAQLSQHRASLSELGIDEVAIELNNASFDEFISELQPDIVMFDRFMMEEQFGWRVEKYCPQALRILDTEDLQSLRHARHQAIKQQREISDDDYASDLAKREIAAILRCDLSLIISSFEYQLLIEKYQIPSYLLHLCPFMLNVSDLVELTQDEHTFSKREHFITIGNFRHAPNWDAVLQLKSVFWPKIRKRLPNAQLHIYGAYPPPKATALHDEKQGFLVKGWVEDAKAVMQQARVCLAPLRFGAGIKGKLAEAMLCGTPNVTTEIGAEGMTKAVTNTVTEASAWAGSIAQNDEQFIEHAIALYQDETQWQLAQKQGVKLIHELFHGEKNGKQLMQSIEQAIDNKEQRRLANFTGAMLRHHSMKSTKYMAQWIEAKNKLESQTS